VIRLAEDAFEFLRVFRLVKMLHAIFEQSSLNATAAYAGTVQQGISCS
jgi:hypothetical protein